MVDERGRPIAPPTTMGSADAFAVATEGDEPQVRKMRLRRAGDAKGNVEVH